MNTCKKGTSHLIEGLNKTPGDNNDNDSHFGKYEEVVLFQQKSRVKEEQLLST